MCGILLQVTAKNKKLPISYTLNGNMLTRGPDDTNFFLSNRIRLIHTRLAISHSSMVQPGTFDEGEIVIAFNGELYNQEAQRGGASEIDLIYRLYKQHGVNYASHLDGEFSIIIIDLPRSIFHITRDFFGTKPLFAHQSDGLLEVCTVADQLRIVNQDSPPTAIQANSTLTYHLDTLELIAAREIVNITNVDFNRSKSWADLFRIELIRKWPLEAKPFIPLSSGHDSGLIAAISDEIGYKPTFYICPRGENLNILSQRIDFLRSRNHSIIIVDLPDGIQKRIRNAIDSQADNVSYIDESFRLLDPVRDDPSPMGLASIYKHASMSGCKVAMSGQGGDEIYSGGYGGFGPQINVSYQLSEDSEKSPFEVYPWRHLKNGRMQQYLLKEEIIASLYSVESRYPLLSLPPLLSYLFDYQPSYREFYKGPIEHELLRVGFPTDLSRFKRGFNPYSMDRSKAFLDRYAELVISAEEIWQ